MAGAREFTLSLMGVNAQISTNMLNQVKASQEKELDGRWLIYCREPHLGKCIMFLENGSKER